MHIPLSFKLKLRMALIPHDCLRLEDQSEAFVLIKMPYRQLSAITVFRVEMLNFHCLDPAHICRIFFCYKSRLSSLGKHSLSMVRRFVKEINMLSAWSENNSENVHLCLPYMLFSRSIAKAAKTISSFIGYFRSG